MSRRRRRSKAVDKTPFEVTIESLSHEGRGVAHRDGKTIFVDGALVGERVECQLESSRNKFDEASTLVVHEASDLRVEPSCAHANQCGGCSLQHVAEEAQRELKAQMLRDQMQHFGNVQWDTWLPPLTGITLGYRQKARLGVKHVPKKGGVLVGFREKRSSFITNIERCVVLDPRVGDNIPALQTLVEGLSCPDRIPQIEVALGDKDGGLIFRHLEPLTEADHQALKAFGEVHDLQIYLQPKGVDTVHKIFPESGEDRVHYRHEAFDVDLAFHPTDFTQVNAGINQKMVQQAIDLLDLQPDDSVLDLFCGLGNFTLPIATQAGHVTGVEGSERMVERGYENARRNGIENVEFYAADLTQPARDAVWFNRPYNKILLDPPRSGAAEVVEWLPILNADTIVYVSCGPATLARDAGILSQSGYRMTHLGIMDMFPHTTHVESMAVFRKE